MKESVMMKPTSIFCLLSMLSFLFFSSSVCLAQDLKFPNASSNQSIVQELGISKITLNYARPNGKGRKIFGALVPYGQVWRTGANNATSITFSDGVVIDGKNVPAGTYALFTIPGSKEWTIILNKNSKQWGAYTYDEKDDFLRFQVKPQTLKTAQETFSISFPEVTENSARINISWEKTAVGFDILVDQEAEIMANITEAMKGEKKPYMRAAQYYYANDKDLSQALVWMDEALKENPKGTYIYYWKALIQLKAGDKTGAVATASEGKKLAEAAGNSEYIKLHQQVINDVK